MSTDNEILNAISDLRIANEDKDELETRIAKLRSDLEEAEDDLASAKIYVEESRDKLDALIDEATGSTDDEPDYESAIRGAFGSY